MHHKKKGRKIFTYRVKNRRVFSPNHPMRRALGTVLLLAVMVFLGVVGYQVIGPLTDRIAAEKESPTLTDDPYFTTEPPVTEPAALTTAASTVTTAVTVLSTAADASAATFTTVRAMQIPDGISAVYELETNEIRSAEVLSAAAAKYAAQGYTALIVPLKLSDSLYYQSGNADAQSAGLIVENCLTLKEISDAVSLHGMSCYARMSMLDDTYFAAKYPDAGFQTEKDGKLWEDPLNGPQISPYSDHTKAYYAALADEIKEAGFSGLILSHLSIPTFSSKDQKALGKQASDKTLRREALTGLINKVAEHESAAIPRFNLFSMLNGSSEAFQPADLHVSSICVTINFAAYGKSVKYKGKTYDLSKKSYAEKTGFLLQIASELAGDKPILPLFYKERLTDEEIESVIAAAAEFGCQTVMINPFEDD
ncbi:MAG: hypothetical protein IK130_10245 [Oscillospiraceae bacterium]|nr:hypothetical protein [Oscillospiraceae bacterium]